MTKNEKISFKLIMKIRLLLLVGWIIVIGFLVVEYIPAVKETLIPAVKETLVLATTVKPETLTELYFEEHLSLPSKVTLFKENNFRFTIHNLENKDMEYPYEVYFEVNGKRESIDKSSVLIKNNEYKTITEEFGIAIPVQRVKVIVNLINKNQQIHFWMREE